MNGHSAKPHKLVRVEDEIEITRSDGKQRLKVRGIADRRGPATTARLLYDDRTPPRPPKPAADPSVWRESGSGRPTKRERRQLDRFRDR